MDHDPFKPDLRGGLFLDGWAHTHGKVDQSFFTPWHAVLYSGFALNFLVLLGFAALNHSRGYPCAQALPQGYGLSLFGMGLRLVGGPGDLMWHSLFSIFSIKEDINALYSPTHLILATGLMLASSGPWRSLWARPGSPTPLPVQLPMLLLLAAALSTLTFFVQFAHPVTNRWGFGESPMPQVFQALGVTGFMVTNALTLGAFLLILRRWRLAPGAFTLVLGLNALAMGFLDQLYPLAWVGIYLFAGVLLDGLYRGLRPEPLRPLALQRFAVLAPAGLMAVYFALGRLALPFNWSVHMLGGVVFIAGG